MLAVARSPASRAANRVASMIAVLIMPGQIAVARTPVSASSARIDKVSPSTANFDAWYAMTRGVG